MENLAPAKHQNTIIAKTLYRKIKVNNGIKYILHLPSGQRIITCSVNGSFQVWDLERGTQLLDEWKEKAAGVEAIALSPGGKTVATGSNDGTLKLWNVNTGKVAKTLTGHRARVHSVCWNRDGERVASGCWGGTFRVWDVESGETIIGPIKAGGDVQTVCYSPDGKMIAISLYTVLKIWDANTGELLKTIDDVCCRCLAWTWDGKALFAGGWRIRKFDTATWTAVLDGGENFVDTILLSPNRRIVATTSYFDKTAQLWNLETNQPIGTPFHHEDFVISATFSADGKFLVTGCPNGHVYTWNISIIIKKAGILSDIVDATPQPAPKMKNIRRIPTRFFRNTPREANLRTQSHGPHNRLTTTPSQRTLGPLFSFWRRFKLRGSAERVTQPRPQLLGWTRNLVSSMVRRQDISDIEVRKLPLGTIIQQGCQLASTSQNPKN